MILQQSCCVSSAHAGCKRTLHSRNYFAALWPRICKIITVFSKTAGAPKVLGTKALSRYMNRQARSQILPKKISYNFAIFKNSDYDYNAMQVVTKSQLSIDHSGLRRRVSSKFRGPTRYSIYLRI